MEDLLTCHLCYINFDENVHIPRQLPCNHNICDLCLPHLKKVQNNRREYIECPACRSKHFVQISSIPKSLVIIQLIEIRRSSLKNQSQASNQHLSKAQKTTNDFCEQTLPLNYSISHEKNTDRSPV